MKWRVSLLHIFFSSSIDPEFALCGYIGHQFAVELWGLRLVVTHGEWRSPWIGLKPPWQPSQQLIHNTSKSFWIDNETIPYFIPVVVAHYRCILIPKHGFSGLLMASPHRAIFILIQNNRPLRLEYTDYSLGFPSFTFSFQSIQPIVFCRSRRERIQFLAIHSLISQHR